MSQPVEAPTHPGFKNPYAIAKLPVALPDNRGAPLRTRAPPSRIVAEIRKGSR